MRERTRNNFEHKLKGRLTRRQYYPVHSYGFYRRLSGTSRRTYLVQTRGSAGGWLSARPMLATIARMAHPPDSHARIPCGPIDGQWPWSMWITSIAVIFFTVDVPQTRRISFVNSDTGRQALTATELLAVLVAGNYAVSTTTNSASSSAVMSTTGSPRNATPSRADTSIPFTTMRPSAGTK